jgi:hypothetical protein
VVIMGCGHVMRTGISLGVTLIDTAEIYGNGRYSACWLNGRAIHDRAVEPGRGWAGCGSCLRPSSSRFSKSFVVQGCGKQPKCCERDFRMSLLTHSRHRKMPPHLLK